MIPIKDQPERLHACVANLQRTVSAELAEIIIVEQSADENTTDCVLDAVPGPHRVIRSSGAFNAAAILNRGAQAASKAATHYLFLHDDVEPIEAGWLEHMLGYAQRADVGIVGATLLYPDDTIQHAGTTIGLTGTHDHVLRRAHFRYSGIGRCAGPNGMLLASRDTSAVTAACLLIRADVFDRLGGFDREFDVRCHDADLCLRTRASDSR